MAHPVDTHVGKKIRQRRWFVGMTQQTLASEVGIKFQQIQKYETGANRVSASRLWEIANTLKVPVSYFFDDYEDPGQANDKASETANILNSKEATELVRAFLSLPENQRRTLLDLSKSLSTTT